MTERSDLEEAQGSNDALVFETRKAIKNINAKSMAKDSVFNSAGLALDSITAQ